jgi:hypothetical protein
MSGYNEGVSHELAFLTNWPLQPYNLARALERSSIKVTLVSSTFWWHCEASNEINEMDCVICDEIF